MKISSLSFEKSFKQHKVRLRDQHKGHYDLPDRYANNQVRTIKAIGHPDSFEKKKIY